MSYFVNLPSKSLYWKAGSEPTTSGILQALIDTVGEQTSPADLGFSGRLYFIRIDDPQTSGNPLPGAPQWQFVGTFTIVAQRFGFQTPFSIWDNANAAAASSPNKLPPMSSLCTIYSNGAEYAITCPADDVEDTRFVFSAVDGLTRCDGTMAQFLGETPTDEVKSFALRCDLGAGPVIPSSSEDETSFSYFITCLVQNIPASGDDFAWRQLTWKSSGAVISEGFSKPNVQSWVFEKVDTGSDPSFVYKIRSFGHEDGYLSFPDVGEEFELLPHPSVFGSFVIRPVFRGHHLSWFLAAPLTKGVFLSPNIDAVECAWQLRPANSSVALRR